MSPFAALCESILAGAPVTRARERCYRLLMTPSRHTARHTVENFLATKNKTSRWSFLWHPRAAQRVVEWPVGDPARHRVCLHGGNGLSDRAGAEVGGKRGLRLLGAAEQGQRCAQQQIRPGKAWIER